MWKMRITVDAVLMMTLCGFTGELGKRLALFGCASIFLSVGWRGGGREAKIH